MWYWDVLWWVELFCIVVAGWTIFGWLCEGWYYLRTLCAGNSLKKYGEGSWAVVTGCTEGIGRGFARTLAKNGFNIILISRNPQKLEAVREEISKLYGVNTQVIVCDFKESPQNPTAFFNRIEEETRDKDVSLVINNVGTAPCGYHHTLDFQEEATAVLAVNLWPVVYMSKIFLRRMVNRPLPSGLLNLSSTATLGPLPGFASYGATKGFINMFTLCINEEIKYTVRTEKLKEIDIMSLQPGYVDTNITKDMEKNGSYISPELCAERALEALGKVPYTHGHWKHILTALAFKLTPNFLLNPLSLKMGVEVHDLKFKGQ